MKKKGLEEGIRPRLSKLFFSSSTLVAKCVKAAHYA